ncbi:MAG TPA: hypothetical protein VH309_00435 [Elusimicrobiota bacterium]|jgi:hypothetical protein|nr:hypothetical protein [Elusimicrobiota bacterium]
MNPSPLLAAAFMALAVSASAPVRAQDFAMPEEAGAVVLSARGLAARAPAAVAAVRAPFRFSAAEAGTPINTGFLALGAAGQTGRVKGPPFGGSGTYDVVENDAARMIFDMSTGYVQGRFTLTRGASTGKDSLGFDGQTKSGPFSGWTPCHGMYDGQVAYDAGSDSGTILWQFNGQVVTDTYRGGRAGSRSMTITLKGHSHTFTQD